MAHTQLFFPKINVEFYNTEIFFIFVILRSINERCLLPKHSTFS